MTDLALKAKLDRLDELGRAEPMFRKHIALVLDEAGVTSTRHLSDVDAATFAELCEELEQLAAQLDESWLADMAVPGQMVDDSAR